MSVESPIHMYGSYYGNTGMVHWRDDVTYIIITHYHGNTSINVTITVLDMNFHGNIQRVLHY